MYVCKCMCVPQCVVSVCIRIYISIHTQSYIHSHTYIMYDCVCKCFRLYMCVCVCMCEVHINRFYNSAYIYIYIERERGRERERERLISKHRPTCTIYIKLTTVVEGDSKAPFSIATTSKCRESATPSPVLSHLTLDPYLIILSGITQPGIESRSHGPLADTLIIMPVSRKY